VNQYGVKYGDGRVERHPRRKDAESAARAWVDSPLRTNPRTASLVRRVGWDGDWTVVASWESPR
jgi:hypothetical protein